MSILTFQLSYTTCLASLTLYLQCIHVILTALSSKMVWGPVCLANYHAYLKPQTGIASEAVFEFVLDVVCLFRMCYALHCAKRCCSCTSISCYSQFAYGNLQYICEYDEKYRRNMTNRAMWSETIPSRNGNKENFAVDTYETMLARLPLRMGEEANIMAIGKHLLCHISQWVIWWTNVRLWKTHDNVGFKALSCPQGMGNCATEI